MPTHTFRRFVIVDDNTVRETRDRQEEARPRKRARVDDDNDNDPSQSQSQGLKDRLRFKFTFTGPSQRDPVYFKDEVEATCYVWVEGTLFKIHKELLDCCEHMAELRDDHVRENGPTTEDAPLKFAMPSVEEYRAFLWALYASPEELNDPTPEHAYVDRLFLIASMTDKYDIPRLQAWVQGAIHLAAQHDAFMESCSSSTLAALLTACMEYKYTDTLPVVEKKWCDRLLGKSTPAVPAIQAAERHYYGWGVGTSTGGGRDKHKHKDKGDKDKDKGKLQLPLQTLKGIAYYVHVQDMLDRQVKVTSRGATQLHTDPKLNNGQVMRLLSGYWSLVSFWDRMRVEPIALSRGAGCTSQEAHQACITTWDRRWVSAAGWKRILGINTADTLALLVCLRDQLSGDDELKKGLHADCRLAGLAALKTLKEDTQDGLADHFFGCV